MKLWKIKNFLKFLPSGRQCRDCCHYHELVGENYGFCTRGGQRTLDRRGAWFVTFRRRCICPAYIPKLDTFTAAALQRGPWRAAARNPARPQPRNS